MRRLLLAAVLLTAAPAFAQAGLRGFVTGADDSQPLIGATVLAQRVGPDGSPIGDPRGGATDLDGLYVVPRLDTGRYLVRVSYVGYETRIDTLTLAGEIRSYDVALRVATGDFEVVVESERTTGGARVTAGVQAIDPKDIDVVPAPDVSGDLASYLTTSPGVVTTGDRGGQLFVRGGEPSQNLVLLDGMALYQPFHVLGFYSAFPSDILAGADLYAGGYPARFGGQVSSVLDIQSRNGNKQRLAAAASVAPFVSAARVEGPIKRGSISFLASGRVSVVEQGAARLVDQDLPFSFGDVFGKVHAVLTPNAQLSVQGIHTYDRGTIGEDVGGAVPEEVRYNNTAAGLRFLYLPNVSALRAEILINGSILDSEQGFDPVRNVPARSSSIGRISSEVHLTYYLPSVDIKSGLFVRTNQLETSLDRIGGVTDAEYFTEAGAYIEPEFRLGPLALQGGLRLQSFPNDGRTYVEPRGRAVLTAGVHELSAAGGLYHQEIIGINDRRDVANVFTAWTRRPGGVVEAWHAIAGYRVQPTRGVELVAEGYYKLLDELSVAEWTAFPRFTTELQPATGEVRGLDLRAELRRGTFYGYVGYGLADVVYDAKGPNLQLWYGEETLRFSPPHDRRHQLSTLVSADVAGFSVAARWQFGSGLPFTKALGFDQYLSAATAFNVFADAGSDRVIYERPFGGRLPTVHRLDLSVDRTFRLRPGVDLTAQAALINAYDRRNLFYYDTFTLRRVDQLPLLPSFGVKLAFND
ncbi:carboxypeptidase regulatory-like domain-containing protein [Rubrivirga sp. IMCC43871]|uniref:TonB-dependent receptor n=1 Tax=Rubrivirga sp. IMCC43871 TaxID=3391575 RepID=UPI00398FFE36